MKTLSLHVNERAVPGGDGTTSELEGAHRAFSCMEECEATPLDLVADDCNVIALVATED